MRKYASRTRSLDVFAFNTLLMVQPNVTHDEFEFSSKLDFAQRGLKWTPSIGQPDGLLKR
jgi:hypothetical protein